MSHHHTTNAATNSRPTILHRLTLFFFLDSVISFVCRLILYWLKPISHAADWLHEKKVRAGRAGARGDTLPTWISGTVPHAENFLKLPIARRVSFVVFQSVRVRLTMKKYPKHPKIRKSIKTLYIWHLQDSSVSNLCRRSPTVSYAPYITPISVGFPFLRASKIFQGFLHAPSYKGR